MGFGVFAGVALEPELVELDLVRLAEGKQGPRGEAAVGADQLLGIVAAQHRGGDGGIRKIQFLETMTASILSNSRKTGSFGLAGGLASLPGENRVERADGKVEKLTHIASVEMNPGDVFIIETPGGGGFGK